MTESEKRVLALSKTLQPIDKNYLADIANEMEWFDWDVNCHYADFIRIGQTCEEWQVIRHFDVEMEKRWCMVNKNNPEDWPEWASEVEMEDFDEFEEDGETYCDIFYNDWEVYGEFAQHWINCISGEIIMIGKTENVDSPYCDIDNEYRVVNKSHFPSFYHAFNACVGNRTQHRDLSVNKLLLAKGYKPLNLQYYDDLNYVKDDCIEHDYYEMCGDWQRYIQCLVLGGWSKSLIDTFGFRSINYLDNEAFVTAFKIAIRHKYTLKVSLAKYAVHINNLLYLGKDIHNPHFVAPTKDVMDMITRQAENRRRKEREAEERERRRKEAYENEHAEELFKELRKDFLPIEFSNEHFAVHVLQSKAEYFEEGEAMHHCVGKMGFWKKPSSICIGIRALDGHREATAEISLNHFNIIQCYSYCDKKHAQDEEIRSLIMSYMWMFKLAAEGKEINVKQAI